MHFQDDDTAECRERLEDCPDNVTSCSSVLFQSGAKTHTRKFCTASGWNFRISVLIHHSD